MYLLALFWHLVKKKTFGENSSCPPAGWGLRHLCHRVTGCLSTLPGRAGCFCAKEQAVSWKCLCNSTVLLLKPQTHTHTKKTKTHTQKTHTKNTQTQTSQAISVSHSGFAFHQILSNFCFVWTWRVEGVGELPLLLSVLPNDVSH